MRLRITGEGIEELHDLEEGETVLGRTDDCGLCLRVRSISRKHAKFVLREGRLSVEDVGSSNGILIGGKKIEKADLKPGDEMQIGTFIVKVEATQDEDDSDEEKTSLIPPPAAGSESGGDVPAPEEPDEEDEPTPFDPSMLPAPADANPTQVVSREGRLFIRDPATGREVEVAPVVPGGAIAEAGRKRPSRVKHVAIGTIAVIAAAVALKLLTASQRPPVQEPPPKVLTAQEYSDLLLQGLSDLDNGDVTAAMDKTLRAYKGRPSVPVARIAADIIKAWPDAQKGDLDRQRELVLRLRELRRAGADARLVEFANRQLEKLAGEAQYEADVAEAKALYENGDVAQAWERIRGVPESSATRAKFAELIAACRKARSDSLRESLARDSAAGRWGEAINSIDALLALSPDDKAELESRRLELRQKQGISERIEEAEKALAEGNIEQAERIVPSLPEREREQLGARIEFEKQLRKARIAYNAGNVPVALSTLEGLENPRATDMRGRIAKVFAAWEAARAKENNLDFDGALVLWREIADAETDAENFFLKEALAAEDSVPKKREDAAARLQRAGDEARLKSDFAEARKNYAASAELGGEASVLSLAALAKEGELDFNKAMNQEKSDPKEAIRLYKLVLAKLPADHRFCLRARESLAKLEPANK
ncbi:MAG TPA: FHA domain-containing protein [Candidatus Brocadiia bacterium]|nr:FHA domain-containing protein [Candidatus Brocadiia bacterium]